ncbi:MAG TPA: acyl-CoA dehydrogenase family protein [Gemmatimonadales bacterium]|jgi:hypothetical protein
MSIADLMEPVDEQRRQVVGLAREVAQSEIVPNAARWDAEHTYPEHLDRKLAELGFFGMLIPEEFGGLGLDLVTYLMVIEEIAAASAAISVGLSVHNSLAAGMVLRHGSDAQRRRWLEPMASGDVLAAFALSEPDAGSDAAAVEVRAGREGTDWVLEGAKAWVTNGSRAHMVVVMARTDPKAHRKRGISAFLVPAATKGCVPQKPEDKMGLRASPTTGIVFQHAKVGSDALLGAEGMGLNYALEALDHGRLGIAAQAVGIARSALDHSVRYAAERKQFDKPLTDFQAIQFKLADMATRVAASRALLYEAARIRMRGEPAVALASMAKLMASESATWVTNQAVQVFGGYGYMRDYPVERLFRDAKVTEIYEGTSEVQRIIIARALQED